MIKRIYREHKETLHNFFWRNIQTFSRELFYLIIYLYTARVLSAETFGFFNFIMALVGLLTIFCDFGISTSTSKYVAEYAATDTEKLSKALFSVALIVLAASSAVSVLVVLFGKMVFRANYIYVLMMLPYLFLAPLGAMLDGFYRGLKEFRKLSVITLSVIPVLLSACLFLIKEYALTGALLSINIINLAMVIALAAFRRESRFKIDTRVIRNIMTYAFFIGLANIAYFLYTRVDILILKQFGYVVEIGYYGLINSFFAIILIPPVMLGQVIAPNVAKNAALNDYPSIRKKFLRSMPGAAVISVLVSLLLYLVIPLFLKAFFPKYYTADFLRIFNVLMLLLPFKICGVFFVNGFITPGGFVKIITVLTFISGTLNVISDYVFISLMGFIGVFYTTLVIHSLNIVTVVILFYRKMEKLSKRTAVLAAQNNGENLW